MALNFTAYPRDDRNERNAQYVQQLGQGLQGIGQTVAQNRLQQQQMRRQAMLDQLLRDEAMRKQAADQRDIASTQRAEDYKYGVRISPDEMISPEPGAQGPSMPFVEGFERFRAGGLKPEAARPRYIKALGEDERKQFYENANPKASAQPAEESYTIAGVDANGNIIQIGNKSGKPRVIPTPTPGPLFPKNPSDAQGNAALFGERASQANEQLNKLTGENNFDPTTVSSGVQSGLPNMLNIFKSENVQTYDQIKKNFMAAVLRKESGALRSDKEMETGNEQYFPQTGDKPDVLANKEINRQTAINGLQKMAGPLAVKGTNNQQVPSSSNGDGTVKTASDGNTYIKRGGQWYRQ